DLNVVIERTGETLTRTVRANKMKMEDNWTGDAYDGNDIAILRLPELVALPNIGFDIYRNTDEVGKTFTLVGYGRTGRGGTGSTGESGQKRKADNIYDETGTKLTTDPLVTDPTFDAVLNRLGRSVHDSGGRLPLNPVMPNGSRRLVYDFD